jgi:hypothetical protein
LMRFINGAPVSKVIHGTSDVHPQLLPIERHCLKPSARGQTVGILL